MAEKECLSFDKIIAIFSPNCMNIASPKPLNERYVTLEGKKLLYFGGCDYLRLSHHSEIRHTAIESLKNSPSLSSSASRITTGDRTIYQELERHLASANLMEDAILTGAGYLANLCLSQFLRNCCDGILMDEHCHPSLRDTAKLTGLPTLTYQHCELNSALQRAKGLPDNQHWFLMSESMFGLDGSVMPIQTFHEGLPLTISFLIDDAHGFGILENQLLDNENTSQSRSRLVIKTLSLAKTIGCHGGAIVATKNVTQDIRNQGSTWVGHTPIPPHLAQAAKKSIEMLNSKPELNLRLKQNTTQISKILARLNLLGKSPLPSPVFSLIFEPSDDVNSLNDMISTTINAGIYPSFIRYPSGTNLPMLRLAISSSHQKEDIQFLENAIKTLSEKFTCKRFLLAEQ